jgi:hypothetical protein
LGQPGSRITPRARYDQRCEKKERRRIYVEEDRWNLPRGPAARYRFVVTIRWTSTWVFPEALCFHGHSRMSCAVANAAGDEIERLRETALARGGDRLGEPGRGPSMGRIRSASREEKTRVENNAGMSRARGEGWPLGRPRKALFDIKFLARGPYFVHVQRVVEAC